MKKNIYITLCFALIMVSCASEKAISYTIASQKADCIGVAPQECMLIKKGNSNSWQYFYSTIEGFNYEEGYEYLIHVKEEKLTNVPADASSIKYIMTKQISKTAKTSENLPQAVIASKGYQSTGKVILVDSKDVGSGAVPSKTRATLVKIEVTSSANKEVKEGDTISCELIALPKVMPVVGREYVFKAKEIHPDRANGVYLLETDVMDLIY